MTGYIKIILISTLLTVPLLSCHQKEKSYVLIDHRADKKDNPYKNELDSLYQQPEGDSIEIYYVPQITPPILFTLNPNSKDTLYLSETKENGIFNTQKLWDYFETADTTLYKGLISARFNVYLNWDGKVFFVEVSEIAGNFKKKNWKSLWNTIQSIPSKQDGILNEYRFTQKLTIDKNLK